MEFGEHFFFKFEGIFHFAFSISQVKNSDDRTVRLQNLHVDMTGKYTCEVSTEGIFETAVESGEMVVVGKSAR